MKVRGGQKGLDLISVVQATKGDNAKTGGGEKTDLPTMCRFCTQDIKKIRQALPPFVLDPPFCQSTFYEKSQLFMHHSPSSFLILFADLIPL